MCQTAPMPELRQGSSGVVLRAGDGIVVPVQPPADQPGSFSAISFARSVSGRAP